MPIRMVDDPESSDQNNNDTNNSGGGGNFPGGGLFALIPILLSLFRGKGIIVLLILAGGAYFIFGRGGCNNTAVLQKIFSQSGYNYDPNQFGKASVYEGLEDDSGKNPLPEAVSLLRFAPKRLNQGQQGSCVAWSSAYGAQTIAIAAATGDNPDSIAFSPSYLYNQIRLQGCDGSYVQNAMETMQKNGGMPLSQYPYNDHDCDNVPTNTQLQDGKEYAIHGFTRLTNGDDVTSINIRAIKEHLAKDAPVVIGMMVGNSFMEGMKGQQLWTPQGDDASQTGMGGHALCVIGYDDRKFGGAFQIMNSWGSDWGEDGIAWVRYGDFKNYVREAYGIDPLPKATAVANIPLECTIGLVQNETKKYIPLKVSDNNLFETTTPITKGTKFKMEIKNATACYIYIFGQDTDGSSYVLFPYTAKHSPYCGITGYRLFPYGQSLMADSVGNKDYMAIVVSKDSLDYNQLNQSINQSHGDYVDYAARVNDVLRNMLIQSAKFSRTDDGTIYFKVDANTNKAVVSIVAIDKR